MARLFDVVSRLLSRFLLAVSRTRQADAPLRTRLLNKEATDMVYPRALNDSNVDLQLYHQVFRLNDLWLLLRVCSADFPCFARP